MSNCETVAVTFDVEDIAVEVVCVEPQIEVRVTMSPTWADVSDKPAAFAPSAHAASHAAGGSDPVTLSVGQVSGLQAALDSKATPADVTAAVSGLVNSAPAALDTLNELAAALGNDANFAATVTTALAAKAPLASPTFTGTVGGITKGMVGLGNVDNTADASKPVSTAQAAADAAVASAAAADATSKANAAQAAAVQRANHTGTQAIATVDGLQTALDAKAATTDARLSDARTPTAHKSTHATGGTDALTPADIGAVATNDSRLTDQRVPTDGSVTDAKITAAGLSTSSLNWAAIQPWAANTAYAKGDLVSNAGIAYRRSAAGTSGATFNVANWQQITPTDFVASQIASGTIARARYSADLGTGSMTVSGSNSHGVSLDTTARTLTQANTLAIMGGPVGIGTLTPLATGGLEVAAPANTGNREILRVRNTTAGVTGTFDIGIGTTGYFQDQALVFANGVMSMRFLTSPAGQVVFASSLRLINSAQVIGDSNANAYIEMNNGAGQLSLSSVSVMSFQRSYVEVGRWDTNSVWNVGTGHASAASSGGSSVTGTQARVRFPGQVSTAAGQFAAAGDAQASRYHLRNTTTNATATTLFRDGSAARITIPAQSCWSFKIRLSAYNSTDGVGAAWIIDGGIRRDNANSTVLLGTPAVTQFADTAMASATVAVTADDTNEALQVNVTGLASKTIRWHAVVETSEVSGGTPS